MKNIQIKQSFRIKKGCFSVDISGIFDFFSGDFYYKNETDEFHKPLYFKKLKITKDERQTVFYFVGSNDFVVIEKDFARFHFNGVFFTVTDKEKIKMVNELFCKINSETKRNTIYSIIQSYKERYTDSMGVFHHFPSKLIQELHENGFSEKEIEKILKKYF